MKIGLPVISMNISVNVSQRPGAGWWQWQGRGEVGRNQSLPVPSPHPHLERIVNENQITQLCHFSHCHGVFVLFCCFWSVAIEMSYNGRRKLAVKPAILNALVQQETCQGLYQFLLLEFILPLYIHSQTLFLYVSPSF